MKNWNGLRHRKRRGEGFLVPAGSLAESDSCSVINEMEAVETSEGGSVATLDIRDTSQVRR